jgi:hypothetical protein
VGTAVQSNPFLAHRRARYLRASALGIVRRAAKRKTLFIVRRIGPNHTNSA